MTRLSIPDSGPGRLAALERLALALFRQLGPTGTAMLIALADELLNPDDAPQRPVQGRAPSDGQSPAPTRHRAPAPAGGRA